MSPVPESMLTSRSHSLIAPGCWRSALSRIGLFASAAVATPAAPSINAATASTRNRAFIGRLPRVPGTPPVRLSREALSTPRSVISPVTSRAGVTSKRVVRDRRAVRHDLHRLDPAIRGAAGHGRLLLGAALLDRNFGHAVRQREVDGRRRQRHIERHVVVLGGERLQISADLVADVALRGDAVGADDRPCRPCRAASDGRRCCRRSPCAARRAGRAPRR